MEDQPENTRLETNKLRSIIREEVDRNAARHLVESISPEKSQWSSFFRHPMTLTTFGFLLTAGIGAYIENNVTQAKKRAQDREELVAQVNADELRARTAILDFATIAHTRLTATDLLRSAIARRAEPSLLPRKENYDSAYLAWNIALDTNLVDLRQVLRLSGQETTNEPSDLEKVLKRQVAAQFATIDSCLTTAFDSAYLSIIKEQPNVEIGCPATTPDWVPYVRNRTVKIRGCIRLLISTALSDLRAQADHAGRLVLTDDEMPPPRSEIMELTKSPCQPLD